LLSYNILQTSAAKALLVRHERVRHISGREKLRLPRIAAF
jgi:hypothetical protein